jgi:hypothetical protein
MLADKLEQQSHTDDCPENADADAFWTFVTRQAFWTKTLRLHPLGSRQATLFGK